MEPDSTFQKTEELLTGYLSERSKDTQQWIFCVHHSLRVEGLVRQILAGEPRLPEKTSLTLRVAALLHDIGVLDGRANHAENGARIVETLLETKGAFLNDLVLSSELISLVRHHSRYIDVPVWTELGILRDADSLDGVGAMSILKEANQGEYMEADFYSDLYTRFTSETLGECDTVARRLFTSTAKTVLAGKRAFIENFILQLHEEHDCAHTFQMHFSKSGLQAD